LYMRLHAERTHESRLPEGLSPLKSPRHCHVTHVYDLHSCCKRLKVQYEPDAAKWEAANTTEGLAAASSTLLDMTRYWDQYYPPADVAKQLALPYRWGKRTIAAV
jgi:hypothetical protein